MFEIIGILNEYYAGQILLVVGIILILIDYYFPVDLPAHFGYFCIGASTFFMLNMGLLPSLFAAVAAWLLLAVLHQFWFKRFLTNAPGAERRASDMADDARA